jgi:hypothetical protein
MVATSTRDINSAPPATVKTLLCILCLRSKIFHKSELCETERLCSIPNEMAGAYDEERIAGIAHDVSQRDPC